MFDALDKLEKVLDGKDYLVGNTLTEADVRLWVTLVCPILFLMHVFLFTRACCLNQIRFDPVYVGHFKCNLRTIRDGYPITHRFVALVLGTEGIADYPQNRYIDGCKSSTGTMLPLKTRRTSSTLRHIITGRIMQSVTCFMFTCL